jgi:predicted enzyme related to lactoylglutathione lyase
MASHRSRLCGALLDVPRSDYQRTVTFWQAVLDREGEVEAEDPSYTTFGDATPGVELMVQAIGEDPPRIHLDIETDDVDAEVRRLGALGATELKRIESWVVMRDPVGTVFCVVPVQNADAFGASATTWTA